MRPPSAPRAPKVPRVPAVPAAPAKGDGATTTQVQRAAGARGAATDNARGAAGTGLGSDLVLSPEELDGAWPADGEWVEGEDWGADEEWGDGDGSDWEGEVAAGLGAAAPVTQLEDRLKERRRASRRVLWTRIGILTGSVAALAALGWVVLVSSLLALEPGALEVEGGGPYVDVAAVTQVVDSRSGTPLARLDTGGIAAELAAMPAVEQASVSRSWPHGVVVTIQAREPVAATQAADGTMSLVGADGVVVAQVAPEAVPAGVPLLAVDMATPQAAESVTAVLTVLAELPAELRDQIASTGAAHPEAIELVLTSGSRVLWGSADQTALKSEVLLTLLQVGAATYDVTAPEAPIAY